MAEIGEAFDINFFVKPCIFFLAVFMVGILPISAITGMPNLISASSFVWILLSANSNKRQSIRAAKKLDPTLKL